MRIDSINPKPEFYKDKEGIETEGFLDDAKFNGVTFLLREPNSNGEDAVDFWFKKVVHNKDNLISTLTKPSDKASVTRYSNYTKKCLKQIQFNDEELKHCAYMNLHPYSGKSSASGKYKDTLKEFDEKHERWKVIEDLRPEVIFTCVDIYNKIKRFLKIEKGDEKKEGIKYKDKTIPYFEAKIANKVTRIYAIYHPSAPKSILDSVLN